MKKKIPEKALYWFKKAAAAGDVQAQMYCAAAYLFGLGTKENSDTARKYYIDAAKAGNALAQYTLGMHFLESRDQRNKKLGAVWLTKAADQGFTEAQAKLGELYANGSVVTRDNNKAVDLLMKAAAQNSSSAMTTLGELAIKQNQIETGKDWLTKAANAHNGRAAMSLARLYLDQKSSIYNPQTGFMWTLQAAQNGSGEAQQALALLYKEGKGVAMNPQLAEQWELKAKATLAKKDSEVAPAIEAARWLSNGKTDNFTDNSYSLGGIYSAWQNPLALKENNYNSAPQMETVSRAEIYKPNFTMVQPSEIPINDYFDLIAPMLNANHVATWTFPRYPLDKQIEALQANESLALEHKPRQSMVDEGSPYPEKPGPQDFNYFKEKR